MAPALQVLLSIDSFSIKGDRAILVEKNDAPARHSYGITLHSWAYQSLFSVFKIFKPAFRQCLAVGTANGGFGRVYSSKQSKVSSRKYD
jgi:hypothetical protein